MKNPFRFGGRWSWCRIRHGRPYRDPVNGLMVPVTVDTNWRHPLAWLFIAVYALKHCRLRIERAR